MDYQFLWGHVKTIGENELKMTIFDKKKNVVGFVIRRRKENPAKALPYASPCVSDTNDVFICEENHQFKNSTEADEFLKNYPQEKVDKYLNSQSGGIK